MIIILLFYLDIFILNVHPMTAITVLMFYWVLNRWRKRHLHNILLSKATNAANQLSSNRQPKDFDRT